jgi:hypothetical protein
MERADVLEQIAAELTHIPRWPGEHQGLLRAIYRLFRANNLRAPRAASAKEILHRCIATIQRDYPIAQVEYDQAFFHN